MADLWDTPPAPGAGSLFVDTGYRVVIELGILTSPDTRTYGMLTYGDGVYGSADGLGVGWVDVTCAGFGIAIRRGAVDGSPFVDVDEATIDVYDPAADLFPMDPAADDDGIRRAPGTGTPVRVSFVGPGETWHPLFTGKVDAVVDTHAERVRLVSITAYGTITDLAGATVDPVKLYPYGAFLQTSIDVVLAAAGWSWGSVPAPPWAAPFRTPPTGLVNARTELDRLAMSGGCSMSTDGRGRIRFLSWPHPSTDPPAFHVIDRKGIADTVAGTFDLVSDTTELLNDAQLSTNAYDYLAYTYNPITDTLTPAPGVFPVQSVRSQDLESQGAFGAQHQTLGAPYTNLGTTDDGNAGNLVTLALMAAAITARYGRIVQRVPSAVLEYGTDPRCFPAVLDADAGDVVVVERTAPTPLTIDAVVVGVEYAITPRRITTTLRLTTVTPTEI